MASGRKMRFETKITIMAAQCINCKKWRAIADMKTYEEIREKGKKEPFECIKAMEYWGEEVSCNDPSLISLEPGVNPVWASDCPGIPVTPPGWTRLIMVRYHGKRRFADVYYRPPGSKKMLRSTVEVAVYIRMNPEVQGGLAEEVKKQFSFSIPRPFHKHIDAEPTEEDPKRILLGLLIPAPNQATTRAAAPAPPPIPAPAPGLVLAPVPISTRLPGFL